MKRLISTFLFILIAFAILKAEIILPSIIGDNMVLQQNSNSKLWGKCIPNSKISISTSWSKKSTSVNSDKDGNWLAEIQTPTAGGPYSIEIKNGKEKKYINNVLIGEVWFCSGQSNMEMPMKGFDFQPIEGSIEDIISAKPSTNIRMCKIKRTTSKTILDECETSWLENTSENVANTSATAYYFAKRLQSTLNIPIGIIVSSWGGTPVESWMSRESISNFKEFDLSFLDNNIEPKKPQSSPSMLYNAMVAPITNYNISGFIWYQGESNRTRATQYRQLMKSYVAMMRKNWNLGELPFYYVQIAPYIYDGEDKTSSAELREAQMLNLSDIPNSGMAVTLDIGDNLCIHPAKKKEVGDRLAFLALSDNYGVKAIEPRSPIYKSLEIKDNKAYVHFTVDKYGIAPLGQQLKGFEIAGKDKKFYPANAKINRQSRTVVVECPEVPNPVAVRYCYKNYTNASLFNTFGMPASSFRTDNWE